MVCFYIKCRFFLNTQMFGSHIFIDTNHYINSQLKTKIKSEQLFFLCAVLKENNNLSNNYK